MAFGRVLILTRKIATLARLGDVLLAIRSYIRINAYRLVGILNTFDCGLMVGGIVGVLGGATEGVAYAAPFPMGSLQYAVVAISHRISVAYGIFDRSPH